MHGYGEALQALAFLNSVDGGSVGYMIASGCLYGSWCENCHNVSRCLVVCMANTQGGMLLE